MRDDRVPGDVDASANPHVLAPAHVVEKSLQRGDAPGTPAEPRMQPDRQHLGRVLSLWIAFAIQGVERVLQVVEELRAGIESLGGGEAHVVGVERVRYDQVRHPRRGARY